jgi:hypothetical protein
MDPQHPVPREPNVPMVLRSMPVPRYALAEQLADCLERPDCVLWEFVDATADEATPPAGVAVTRPGPADCVTVSVIQLNEGEADTAGPELLRQLIATFRGRATRALYVNASDESVVTVLIAMGFAPSAVGGPSPYVLTL